MTRRVIRGAFVAPELDRRLRAAGLSGRARSLATDLVYGALRHRRWLDAALSPHLRAPGRLPEAVAEALRLGAFDKLVRGTPPHAAVDEWVRVVRAREARLAGLANAVLRKVEAPRAPDDAVRLSLPDWLWSHLSRALGPEAARRAAEGMLRPGPLWLTTFGATASEVAAGLRAEGAEAEAGPVPGSLRVRPRRALGALTAYRDGAVQAQNPASAWVARAVAPEAGERVLDLASGAGIKAAVLASMGARVTAVERAEGKIAAARANLARLGLRVEHRQADLAQLPPDLEPAGRVLLDAPCSGTGTLRGHPEIKLRLGADDVAELAAIQARLLDTAAQLTAPGGRLVYAVCALTEAEGPAQVAALRARYPDLQPEPVAPPLPHLAAGDGAFLLPVDGLDGFFVASLRRA